MDHYETRYSYLSDSEVNELYRESTWKNLSFDARLDALQELENRSALACGNTPCLVKTEAMNGYMYGGYANGQIVLNEHLVNAGEFVTQYKDGTVEHLQVDGINAPMMDTIHHENYHAYQEEVIQGNIDHSNAEEAELWAANWPNDQYIGCNDPSGCYRLQSVEKTAFDHGEAQTKAAFSAIEAKYGQDNGYQNYLSEIEENSYQNALENAISITGDENIENTINENMLAAYHEGHNDYNTEETYLSGESDNGNASVESDVFSLSSNDDEMEDSL